MDFGNYLDIAMFGVAIVLLLTGFPVAFTLAGTGLIFAFLGVANGVFDFAFVNALPQRIYGTMTNEVLIAVPLFVFMGVTLERSRVAEELLETMGQLFGPMRGGVGIAVCIVGALLAASTGIVGATVVTMGLLSLPTMLRYGYSPALASGTIAASGTLGQIIPPSIVLVILGDQISNAYQESQRVLQEQAWANNDFSFVPGPPVSVGDLFAGALLPGIILVLLYILYMIFIAFVSPKSAPPVPRDPENPITLKRVFHALVPPIVLIVAVLGSILAGVATPTEAAAVGGIGALLLAGYRLEEDRPFFIYAAALALFVLLVMVGTMDLRVSRSVISEADQIGIYVAAVLVAIVSIGILVSLARVARSGVLTSIVRSTGEITSMVFVILIGAALFSLVFRGLGGDDMVEEALSGMPGGALGAMIAVMLIMFVLGFFLDFLEIVFVVVPLVAPVLLMLEMPDGSTMSPVWLGIMMAVNLQTSFLTPPFGFALFYLRGVAPPEVRTTAIYRGIIPFVIIQIGMLVALWYIPSMATWLPTVFYGN
ncbi:TRAP transporter large permease subunit [Acuticoccus sp. I52.16.1]|uniref:TRAP transporter large permease n=1 Tax=Acuticoccus sp. I52.16.1 TaxID=2928472 RepID=UPI001FD4A562|nr:TRAP transporter large permease subunit [Acuticoccus sp. I52.16.1]UOM36275.1 TRAP transporter large permease subunit [Acuticoccus sp. I52.16.1]